MKRKFGWLIFVVVALVVPALLFSTGHAERFTLNHETQAKQAQLLSGASLKSGLVPSVTTQQGEREGTRARLDQAVANEKADPTKEAKLEVEAALEAYNREVSAQKGVPQDGPNALDSVPLPFTGTETENNGTSATANAIDVSGQRTAIISASLSNSSDIDFFTFTAAAGTKVWLYTDSGGTQAPGANSRDTLIDLFAADGTTLIEGDDDDGTGNGGDGTVETVTAAAIGGRTLTTGGTYFVRVTALNGTVNPYRLFVVVTTTGAVAEVDNNGSAFSANTIVAAGGATAGLRSGAINAGGDFDYFAVAADAGNTIYFNADCDPERNGGTDLVLQLRGPSDNLLLTADASTTLIGDSESSNYVVPTSGVYYIRVSHFDVAGTGTYNLMVSVAGGADLGITKVTSNPTPTNGGAAFSYTLTVTNFGPEAATDVVITDPLPPGIIFHNVAVNTTPGSSVSCISPPVATNGTVICNSSNFLAGQVAVITIVAQALPDQASGVRTNTATVTSATPQPQPDVHPNSASVQQNLLVDAPLSITKAGPADICAGATYTYHVTILNGGSSQALNATIVDPLPANTTFLSVVGTGGLINGCAHNGGTPGTVSCAAVDLPSGLSTMDITVRLAQNAPTGPLGNTAQITTAGTGTIAVGTSTTTATVNSCTSNAGSLSIGNASVTEGSGGTANATFTVTLASANTQPVTVDFVTSDGTASAPGDYTPQAGTLTFAPGVTSRTIIVPVIGDSAPEPTETFLVTLFNPTNATINTAQGTGTINDDDATGVLQFSAATAAVNENAVPGSINLTINRTGDTTGVANVSFETSDLAALQKTDYTFNSGTVQFGPGDTSKTINVLIVNDALVETPETFRVSLLNPSGNFVVGPFGSSVVTITSEDVAAGPNPIDTAGFFVRQQYLDFLGREADGPGLTFWTNQITACGANAACIQGQRVNVSAAFFLSIEFQETSGNVIRIQRAAFGRQSADPSSRVPYLQFMRDTRQVGHGVVIGQAGADALLEQNKQAYATQIATSAAFIARFPFGTGATYVDALYASAGVTPTPAERTAAINAYGAGGTSGRVAALRSVSDSESMRTAEFRTSFVLAQYYGYLRRNPTDAPDFNDTGYQFWLAKLNAFNGSYQNADMVKSFIESVEYRGRFGTP